MRAPIETVRGSAYEMGHQHGRLFRHVIHANVAEWANRHTFEGTVGEMDAGIAAQRAVQEEYCPWVFEELRGIAAGSDVDYPWIERMHLRVWNTVPKHAPSVPRGCTAIGMLTEGDGAIVGGTLDDPRSAYVMIRRIPKDGIPHIFVTWAGTGWGHNGVNEAGLALAQASLGWTTGAVPESFSAGIYPAMYGRLVVQLCANVEDALKLGAKVRGCGSNVMADAAGNVVARQGMGEIIGTQRAGAGRSMVFCANHIHLPELVSALAKHGAQPEISDYSRGRFEVLESASRELPPTVGTMQHLLRSHTNYPHSICNGGTVNANYALPQKEPGVFHLADKPPCRSEFAAYAVSDRARARARQ